MLATLSIIWSRSGADTLFYCSSKNFGISPYFELSRSDRKLFLRIRTGARRYSPELGFFVAEDDPCPFCFFQCSTQHLLNKCERFASDKRSLLTFFGLPADTSLIILFDMRPTPRCVVSFVRY